MKIIVNGSCGRMGREVVKLIEAGYRDSVIAAAVDINQFCQREVPDL